MDPVTPAGYGEVLALIARDVRDTRLRALSAAGTEVIALNWRIGALILERQDRQGWVAQVIDRLSKDLQAQFPRMTGLSPTNMQYMRAFAAAWPAPGNFPTAVGKRPWGHVRTLLDRLDDRADREWYASCAVDAGWSRTSLEHHVATGLRQRIPILPKRWSRTPPSSTFSISRSDPRSGTWSRH